MDSKDKVIELQGKLIEAQSQLVEKDQLITELTKNCDTLAAEIIKMEKPNDGHKELVEVIDAQKIQLDKLMAYCEGLVGEVQRLKKTLME